MKNVKFAVTAAMILAWVSGSQSALPAQSAPASRPAIIADFKADVVSQTQGSGMKITRYEHDMLKEWGYGENAGKKPFVVVELIDPGNKTKSGATTSTTNPDAPVATGPVNKRPLLVYLHGAGGKATEEIPEVGEIPSEFIVLGLDCAVPKGPEGWYGWFWADSDRAKYANAYSPSEHRYLAEIEWVARKYDVDRNRIYLSGNSMGGSGTLGLGMARGDIFAAIWVGVPAGIDHVWFRMGFPQLMALPRTSQPTSAKAIGPTSQMTHDSEYLRRISGVGLPDAPPIVNFSSQTDGWAKNQEILLQACHDGRHLLVFCWAPFGHTHNYDSANPIALTYPWLSIRKDQAYPVFTDATSDQKYPGLWNKEGDQQGQLNVYFRWKAMTDEPAVFQMELWMADSKATTRPVDIPLSATVNITPRRLQRFKVEAAKSYVWRITDGQQTLQSGTVRPDETGLLTIPRVTLTGTTRMLTIEPEK